MAEADPGKLKVAYYLYICFICLSDDKSPIVNKPQDYEITKNTRDTFEEINPYNNNIVVLQ